MNIGIQLFSLPKMLETDLVDAIHQLSQMGYTELELYGPYPFSAASAHAMWNAVTPMLGFSGSGYFGKELGEFKQILDDYGMKIPSMHTDLDTLMHNIGPLAEAANTLGCTYLTLPAIPDDKRVSLEGYHKIADTFNQIGENAKKEGVKFAYHNHGYGLQEVEGQTPLNIILNQTDSSLVFFEMDIFWSTAGGLDPITHLKKFPNRYPLLHLKDMTAAKRFSGDGGSPQEWMELFPFMTTAGDGVLNVREIVQTGIALDVEHIFVEQDMVDNPEIALKISIDFLKTFLT